MNEQVKWLVDAGFRKEAGPIWTHEKAAIAIYVGTNDSPADIINKIYEKGREDKTTEVLEAIGLSDRV